MPTRTENTAIQYGARSGDKCFRPYASTAPVARQAALSFRQRMRRFSQIYTPSRYAFYYSKKRTLEGIFAMIANIRLTRPESLIFYPAPENDLRKNADRKALHHPEDRLWKLSTQIASPEFTLMESFVMLVLAMLAFAVLGGCFIGLSQLLQADAIQHIVVQAVQSPTAIGLRWP